MAHRGVIVSYESVCRWCYNKVPLEKLATEAARIGYKGIDLVGPKVIVLLGATSLGLVSFWSIIWPTCPLR